MKRVILIFAVIIAGLSFTATVGANVSPEKIEGATTVSTTEAKALFDKGVVFVDVRKDKDWEAGRIPDAVHLELKKVLSDDKLIKEVKKSQEVVFYCNGPKCMRSSKATAKAVAWGYSKIYYFRDGFPGWKVAGFPVE